LAVQNPRLIDAGELDSRNYKDMWTIFHLYSSDSDEDYRVEFCNGDARSSFRKELIKKDVKELWNLFYNTKCNQGTLRWFRYEAYAHKKILTGVLSGQTMKRLTDRHTGDEIELNLKCDAKVDLDDHNLEKFKQEVERARSKGSPLPPTCCQSARTSPSLIPSSLILECRVSISMQLRFK